MGIIEAIVLGICYLTIGGMTLAGIWGIYDILPLTRQHLRAPFPASAPVGLANTRETTIAVLSEAVEFLSCAIRAAAYGADLKGDDGGSPWNERWRR